ncbi:MAG: mannonate dehydratase [Anaerolineaceae bacterium]|nr:mannonate dehydratase [Anaerolineaceae bacterium]
MNIAFYPVPLTDGALRLASQLGVADIVAGRPEGDSGPVWDFMALLRMRQRVEAAGLKLTVLESVPVTDRVKLGLPGRDEDLDHFCQSVRNMGAAGIPVLCYNWMAGFGWLRTSLADRGRGGALVTSYKHELMQNAPLTEYGEVGEDQLWDAFEYFLKRVVPVAEESGVFLALHPDDPPLSPIRGMARIMRSFEAFKHVIELVPSPNNGLTFCQGNFAAMADVRDVPEAIRYFGERNKIFFAHFRDVSSKIPSFSEVFHDEGPTDMLACMQAYLDSGFDGPIRPDHAPTLEGESNEHPGYMVMGKVFAFGYMRGLIEAARKQSAG